MQLNQSAIADAALAYLSAGLCVLPARRAEKRPAIGRWKQYQERLPTEMEVSAWFANGQDALCIIAGEVSGRQELLDFDRRGELFGRWCEKVRAAAPGLLDRLVLSRTQSNGRHAAYRTEAEICGNLKLAQRLDGDQIVTLIETRGEGGLFLCAPTDGYEIIQGDLTDLPVLTAQERDILLQAAWELNEYVPPVVDGPAGSPPSGQRGPTSAVVGGLGGGLRPGDDFNERGDVRAVLQDAGWTLAKTGENEYWRRPGKIAGWSASLKDGVLYVFSSNAAPFQPHQAYSPFAVYAHLVHDGNYEQAARSLRSLGYGNDDPPQAPGVDISAIVAGAATPDVEPAVTDPGPIPERLFDVPGFIRQVMDFTLANAPYPNIGLAFCGAMALQSYLAGRKVCASGDLRPNIYLLALASSGTGKDFPRKVNARVLYEIGHVHALGDKFASGEGIQDALARCPAMLFQNDEMDGVLRQINMDKENKRESIPNILLTLYSSADVIYAVRVKAGQKDAASIDQPHLTLFGTATPQYFYESLSQRMLTNGFFARLIIVDIGRRGEGQAPGSARHLPDGVIHTARWWAEFQPGTNRRNLLEVHPEPRVVPYVADAAEAITALQRQTEREYNDAHDRNDEVAKIAWSRTTENASKLALLRACSENHETPVIDLPAVQWATTFAMHQTRRQLFLASTYVAATDFGGLCKRALRFLRQCRDSGVEREYPTPDWKLRRHLAQNPTLYDSILEALTKQEEIHFQTIPGRTKPRSGWALR